MLVDGPPGSYRAAQVESFVDDLSRQLQRAQPWRRWAACRTAPPELFFPEQHSLGNPSAAARAICSGCPVRSECLAWALEGGEEFGIWGGTSPRERRRLRIDRLAS